MLAHEILGRTHSKKSSDQEAFFLDRWTSVWLESEVMIASYDDLLPGRIRFQPFRKACDLHGSTAGEDVREQIPTPGQSLLAW